MSSLVYYSQDAVLHFSVGYKIRILPYALPAMVSFNQVIKSWHLITATRHLIRLGVILANERPALFKDGFMVPSGRCLNSLFIYIQKQKNKKTKIEIQSFHTSSTQGETIPSQS